MNVNVRVRVGARVRVRVIPLNLLRDHGEVAWIAFDGGAELLPLGLHIDLFRRPVLIQKILHSHETLE